ncbi:MAG TPA: hypothetical protein ENI99_03220 [Sedimenticola sp.]|nr:hypothetical protein [Sedimenticola sp.]
MVTLDPSDNVKVKLVCVYSLPRSGSTALMAELDRRKSVVCVPESYFPQALELVAKRDLSNPRKMAALFFATSPSGVVLSFEEAVACMVPGNIQKTLVQIGLACAEKTNRDPSLVKVVVWKTTRIIGRWKLFASAGGRFIILRRNLINVFESQFRVDFGRHNRNPLRFAIFGESYEAVFSRLPNDDLFEVDYESIPKQLPSLMTWLGTDTVLWEEGRSTLEQTAAIHPWHKGVMDGFQSMDAIKRRNVLFWQRALLRGGGIVFYLARPFLGFLRDYFDRQIMNQVTMEAERIFMDHTQ